MSYQQKAHSELYFPARGRTGCLPNTVWAEKHDLPCMMTAPPRRAVDQHGYGCQPSAVPGNERSHASSVVSTCTCRPEAASRRHYTPPLLPVPLSQPLYGIICRSMRAQADIPGLVITHRNTELIYYAICHVNKRFLKTEEGVRRSHLFSGGKSSMVDTCPASIHAPPLAEDRGTP